MVFSGSIFWLILIVILCIIEGLTFSLVCIWFAGGALLALISAVIGASAIQQYAVFLVSSGILLILTRPVVKRYVITKKTSTNADRVIGKKGKVIQTINPMENSGQVLVLGQHWSAKSYDGTSVIHEERIVEVLEISGAKLIVQECYEQAEEGSE